MQMHLSNSTTLLLNQIKHTHNIPDRMVYPLAAYSLKNHKTLLSSPFLFLCMFRGGEKVVDFNC